jgi:hypothetical protein
MDKFKYIIVCTLLIFSCTFNYGQANNAQLYQKARIYFNTNNDFKILTKNGVGIDHGIKKSKTYIESIFSKNEIATAKSLGFKVDIVIENMTKYIIEREQSTDKVTSKNATPCDDNATDYQTPANFEVKASNQFGGFYTYSEVLQELDDMRTAFPNLISSRSGISTFSTLNGHPLEWVRISDNPDTDETESEILYTSLHHAREPASMQQLIFYMWYLLENYAANAEVKAIVDNTELYFIPIVNPDGYLYNETTNPAGGGFWRKNRRDHGNGTFGVDNNRNYDYIDGNGNSTWNTVGTSNNTFAENYAGTGPFSEVENQAIKWFVEQHDFKIALNNHTFSNLLLYPFGYQKTTTSDDASFKAISKEMVSQNGYANIISAELFPAAGDSDDFMYGETSTHNEILAMTPEIGLSFWPAQSDIIPICKGMVYHNLTAAHSVNNYATITDTQDYYLTATSGNFDYDIKRLGISGSSNFTVSIVPVSANILSVGASNQHNGLTLLENRSGSLSYTLDPSIGIGNLVEYKLVIDNGLYTTEKIITKIFGTPQFEISENGDNITSWNATNNWNTTRSDFISAPSSITDSPTGNYSNNQNSTIEFANSIDLSTTGIATISFYAKWNIEAEFDYAQFEVSTNNGASWQPQCGLYTRAGVSSQGVSGQPVYDGTQNQWVREFIDLSDYLGETIKVRFQLVSDSSVNEDGFYFDDLSLNTIDQSILGTDSFETINAHIYPNPIKEKLTIELANPLPTLVKIYTISGQLIKNKEIDAVTTILDLSYLNSGIYILQLQTETSKGIYKIIKE